MRKLSGFTLIELVIVVILTGIISAVIANIMLGGFNSYMAGKPLLALTDKTNLALDNLTREIESATSITAASPSTITFVNQAGQTINFTLTGTTLTRSVNGGTANTLVDQVSSLTFNYFSTALATTATPANVSYISVSTTINNGKYSYPIITGTIIRRAFK